MATEVAYVPPEVVLSQILPRLPVRSLLRFRCVCEAWRDTIDDDDSFRREHHRLGKTSLLLAPQVRHDRDCSSYWASDVVTTTGLYRWERSQQGAAATLVHGMDDLHTFQATEAAHNLAHCEGLVLLPSEETVSVLNPATRRVFTLPWSHRSIEPSILHHRLRSHQAFGLGHDPRSNSYKVARFFYRFVDRFTTHNYFLGMEIFTVGTDKVWRDVKKSSPYPVKPGQTATFCKGSLIWTVEQLLLKDSESMPGFVRFNLEDESFSIVPPPPCCSSTVSRLAELRGELCLLHSGPGYMSLEIWMCKNLDDNPPQWDRRYAMALEFPTPAQCVIPKAMFDDEIVLKFGYNLLRYNYRTPECLLRDMVKINDLRYGNPENNDETGTLVEYTRSDIDRFDVIPYVPSLALV